MVLGAKIQALHVVSDLEVIKCISRQHYLPTSFTEREWKFGEENLVNIIDDCLFMCLIRFHVGNYFLRLEL